MYGRFEPDLAPHFSRRVRDTVFRLPGTGKPGEDCGEEATFWCNNCEKMFHMPKECAERQCPHCCHLWIQKEARIMKGRCWDGRDYYRKKGETHRLHHIIVSYRIGIPDDRDAYRGLRRHSYQLAMQAGLAGGCIVFHPWRESRDTAAFDVVGPHFHIFGLGKWIRPSTEVIPYDEDIIFKRVKNFDATQIDPWEYVLRHCGLMDGVHGVVWFGNLAYTQMLEGEREREAKTAGQSPKCPYCGTRNTEYMREAMSSYVHRPGFWIEPKTM